MSQTQWVGKTIGGRYQIEELLGQGGMSSVYKATDPNLKRIVAVKLIHPHLSNNVEFVRRFEEEATGVAQLRHPNIVQVFDFNRDDDVYYMVMEFVPGETLQDRMLRLMRSGRTLPILDTVKYLINVSDAIDYAHKRGMIHRDIKPANIMLDIHSQAILMDFGIAKIIGGQQHTATGAVVGTALYMSPEQIQGLKIDERSDIYSLGVTLYEMVGGRPPFQADSVMTILMMHLHDPVPDLRQLRPDTPPDLAAIIERALAKNRDERFQSAAEMSAALHRVLDRLGRAAPAGTTFVDAPAGPTAQPPQPRPMDAAPRPEDTGPAVNAAGYPVSAPTQGGPSAQPARQPAPQPAANNWAQPRASGTMPPPAGGSYLNQAAAAQPAPRPFWRNPLVIAGGAAGLFLLLVGIVAAFAIGQYLLGGRGGSPTQAAAINPSADENQPAAAAIATQTSAPTATNPPPTWTSPPPPSETPAPTWTSAPVYTPTPEISPTPTIPPNTPYYVRINGITLDANNYYVVEYETFGFVEKLPGMHIHFFFNTVPVEQAGMPGNGPWILYGGPRPFRQYSLSQKPANATQMCALVANSDHSIIPDTGNCWYLP